MTTSKKSAMSDMKDFDKFMSKVNNLESIVNDMVSDDAEKQAEAIRKADKAIKKADPNKNIGFDRTVINKKAFEEPAAPPSRDPMAFTEPHTDQAAFMDALEADASRRAEERRRRYEKADLIKEEGNVFFKNAEYERALDRYNSAISVAKDKVSLYTNRAAVYMKMEKYDKVISDCDFAAQIEPDWVKAYYLKARALQKQAKFKKAKKYFMKMSEYDEKKVKLVEGLLKELEIAEQVHTREEEANKLLSSGDHVGTKTIDQVMTSLREREQKVKYEDGECCFYTVGFGLLESLCIDDKSRTLFRTQGGFELVFDEIKLVKDCLRSKDPTAFQTDLVVSIVALISSACKELNENLKYLLRQQHTSQILLHLFSWHDQRVIIELMRFFYFASLSQQDRFVLYECLDICSISKHLLKVGLMQNKRMTSSTFHNFTIDNKFLKMMSSYDGKSECFSLLTDFLDTCGKDQVVPKTCINSALNLCGNKQLSNALAKEGKFCATLQRMIINEADSTLFISTISICYSMVKSGYKPDQVLFNYLTENITTSCQMTKRVEIVKLLSAVTEHHQEYVDKLQERECLLKQLHELVKNNEDGGGLRTFALKILCTVSKDHAEKLSFLPQMDKKYKLLRDILARDADGLNAIDQGHVALLLGNISKMDGLIGPLARNDKVCSEVIRRLLVLCRDLPDKASRVNCAISLAKLAKAHPRFLYHLRMNDGINILSRQDPSEL